METQSQSEGVLITVTFTPTNPSLTIAPPPAFVPTFTPTEPLITATPTTQVPPDPTRAFQFSTPLIIGISVGGAVLLLSLISLLYFCTRRRPPTQPPTHQWKSQFGDDKWYDLEGKQSGTAGLPSPQRNYHYNKTSLPSDSVTPIFIPGKRLSSAPCKYPNQETPCRPQRSVSLYSHDSFIQSLEPVVNRGATIRDHGRF